MSAEVRIRQFWEALRNRFLAGLVVWLFLSASLLYLPFWEILFSVVESFVIFEAVFAQNIQGGNGFFKFRGKTYAKGQAFIILFVLVLLVTGISSLITLFLVLLTKDLTAANPILGIIIGLVANGFACYGLYAWLRERFFVRG